MFDPTMKKKKKKKKIPIDLEALEDSSAPTNDDVKIENPLEKEKDNQETTEKKNEKGDKGMNLQIIFFIIPASN